MIPGIFLKIRNIERIVENVYIGINELEEEDLNYDTVIIFALQTMVLKISHLDCQDWVDLIEDGN